MLTEFRFYKTGQQLGYKVRDVYVIGIYTELNWMQVRERAEYLKKYSYVQVCPWSGSGVFVNWYTISDEYSLL